MVATKHGEVCLYYGPLSPASLSLTAVIQHQSSLSFSLENVKCAPTEVILSPPESSEMKLQTWQQRGEVISLRAGPGLSTSVSLSARLWTFLFCSN